MIKQIHDGSGTDVAYVAYHTPFWTPFVLDKAHNLQFSTETCVPGNVTGRRHIFQLFGTTFHIGIEPSELRRNRPMT